MKKITKFCVISTIGMLFISTLSSCSTKNNLDVNEKIEDKLDFGKLVGDYYLNVYNSYSVRYLSSLGLKRITLSVELDDNKIRDVMSNVSSNIELIVYGRLELMLMN